MEAQNHVEIHGHRGSRGTHTENSLPSFEAAYHAGCDYIELDVQLSGDDVPVVYHDPSLSGRLCMDKEGGILKSPIPIREIEAEKIQSFRVGPYVHPRFPNQTLHPEAKIPLLEEIFQWQKQREIKLNIELKCRPFSYTPPIDVSSFAEVVVKLVQQYEAHQNTLIQSFDAKVLDEIRNRDATITISRLFHRDFAFFEKSIQNDYKNVTLHYSLLNEENVKAYHKLGIKVLTYTLNRSSQWAKVLKLGVDAIITDYPEKLREYLGDKSGPQAAI